MKTLVDTNTQAMTCPRCEGRGTSVAVFHSIVIRGLVDVCETCAGTGVVEAVAR
jgi:DnaJ-class molecular chaperone